MSDVAPPRVPLLSIEESTAATETARIPPMMAPLGVSRMLLRHPRLSKALSDMLATLLWEPKLAQRLREHVIIRMGWVTGSVYE